MTVSNENCAASDKKTRLVSKMNKKPRNSGRRGTKQIKNRAETHKKPAANAAMPQKPRPTAKITNQRLTIPIGIFNRGVRSATVTRSKAAGAPRTRQHKAVIEEDLHALLNEANSDSSGGTFRSRKRCQAFDTARTNTSCGEYYRKLVVEDNLPQNPGSGVEFTAGLNLRSTGGAHRLTTKKIPSALPTRPRSPRNVLFCSKLLKKIKYSLRAACFDYVKLEIVVIDDVLDGKDPPDLTTMSSSTKKRSIPEDDYPGCKDPVLLVPQSQWVYNTPDKQNMKKFVFEDGNTKFLPAVMHTSKRTKVLYDIKNEYAGHINLNRFKKGDGVPIDKRFLNTICESAVDGDEVRQVAKKKRLSRVKENVFNFDFGTAEQQHEFALAKAPPAEEFNVFQLRDTEESIDIHNEIQKTLDFTNDGNIENLESGCKKFDFGRCMSALPASEFDKEEDNMLTLNDDDNSLPADYKHQLLMATQRPCKTAKKIQKRHLLKAKSLSFENTPPGARVACFEPKKIDLNNSMNEDECLEQFEREFSALNQPASRNVSAPHTITSGALEAQSGLNDPLNKPTFSLVPDFKFFPRRNYDPE